MDYERHKKFYDITDRSAKILSKFNQLSHHIDPNHNLPNSLQATLGRVYRYEGKTQREIAAIYQADYQNLIGYISALEKRGLIYKKSLDAKRKGIHLTDEGRRVNNHLMEARGRLIESALRKIDEASLRITRETLDRMIEQVVEEIERYEKGVNHED